VPSEPRLTIAASVPWAGRRRRPSPVSGKNLAPAATQTGALTTRSFAPAARAYSTMSAARLLTDVRSRPRNSSETDFAVGLVWLQHKPFRSRVRSQVGVSRHEHDQPVRVHLMWGVRTNVVSTVEISHRASCRSVFAAIPGRQDGRELSDPRRVRGIAPTRGVRTTEPGVIKPTELASPRGSSWPVVAILALELPVK